MAHAAREQMVEAIAETDDELLEKYLSGEKLASGEILTALRRGTLELKYTPVFCGTAFRNRGVQPLLDAVVDLLPAPTDVPAITRRVPIKRSIAMMGVIHHFRDRLRK